MPLFKSAEKVKVNQKVNWLVSFLPMHATFCRKVFKFFILQILEYFPILLPSLSSSSFKDDNLAFKSSNRKWRICGKYSIFTKSYYYYRSLISAYLTQSKLLPHPFATARCLASLLPGYFADWSEKRKLLHFPNNKGLALACTMQILFLLSNQSACVTNLYKIVLNLDIHLSLMTSILTFCIALCRRKICLCPQK